MTKRQVFYSFHYKNDVMRVQQIRNIGVLEGYCPVSPNDWEQVRCKRDREIKEWIDNTMQYRSCVIVLIGEKTAHQKWVNYEIKKAWMEGRPLLGIYINNLKCPRQGMCQKGENPFERFILKNGATLADMIPCYEPDPENAYQDIKKNLNTWIENAIENAKYNLRVIKSMRADKEVK
ncbi:MAG: TIR domain-containing protein [Opitutaceae bacterium]|nr:TIR domain-containing protein [Cytophagales bacterium]